jgi:hypothetical protein
MGELENLGPARRTDQQHLHAGDDDLSLSAPRATSQVCGGAGQCCFCAGVSVPCEQVMRTCATLIDAALPAPECDRDEVARADQNRPQSLSARASLHARARPKVVREASRPHRRRPALRARPLGETLPRPTTSQGNRPIPQPLPLPKSIWLS